MKLWQAAVLGAVQGAAEVVPVSSSAQLTLLPWLLGWPAPPHRTAFAAGLHAGSTLGVTAVLRPELRTLTSTPAGRRRAGLVAASCLPVALTGAAVADAVENRLGRPPQVAALLASAGLALWVADRRPQTVPVVGAGQTTAAALAQAIAVAPGMSRSGVALTALRLCRVERAEAAGFSLLMSLPVTAGAAALTLARADRQTLRGLVRPLAVGLPAAAASAAIATAVQRRSTGSSVTLPVLYRIGLAAAVAVRLGRGQRLWSPG